MFDDTMYQLSRWEPVPDGDLLAMRYGPSSEALSMTAAAADPMRPVLDHAGRALRPYVDAYQNFLVEPTRQILGLVARSPLGDPGVWATLQAIPQLAPVGAVGRAGSTQLRVLAGARAPMTVEELIAGSAPYKVGDRTIQYQRSGGVAEMEALFDRLERIASPTVHQGPRGPVTRIVTPHDAEVTRRGFSSGGDWPTIDIRQEPNPLLKLRFPER